MVIIGQEPQEALALEVGEAASYALAKRHFADFLEYVQVLEPPPGCCGAVGAVLALSQPRQEAVSGA